MEFIGKLVWILLTIIFVILCIPLIPFLLLEAILTEGSYDDRRDYYRRYL